jgi:CheY-like chemotaxis protein
MVRSGQSHSTSARQLPMPKDGAGFVAVAGPINLIPGTITMAGRKVLIVDDESYVVDVVGFVLRKAGFEVVVANDGEEAYQIACSQPLNMIVTDFQMPVLSGFELGKLLKSNPTTANIPVIMLTARGHVLTPAQLAQTSIQFLLDKPFSARKLVAKVEELATSADVNPAWVPSTGGNKSNAA